VGAILVLASYAGSHPGWGLFETVDCTTQGPVGNVTVWTPSAVVASPYHGSVAGAMILWTQTPEGRLSLRYSYSPVLNGSVTAFIVGFENWSIFSAINVTSYGPGPELPCSGAFIALFSDVPPEGERHGGTTAWPMYSNLTSDVGLPLGLNGSQLCEQVQNTTYLNCGLGAGFSLNFVSATGSVDTCGSSQPRELSISSVNWPVTAPFVSNGRTAEVPLHVPGVDSQGYGNGSVAWYNYTFPANGGMWQYDDLSQTAETGAGLVFSYLACP